MYHSWMHSPDDRPTFPDVVARLDKLLEDRTSEVSFIEIKIPKQRIKLMTRN